MTNPILQERTSKFTEKVQGVPVIRAISGGRWSTLCLTVSQVWGIFLGFEGEVPMIRKGKNNTFVFLGSRF